MRYSHCVARFCQEFSHFKVEADRTPNRRYETKIAKLSYEYSKKHRITEGAIVMVASLGQVPLNLSVL